MGAGVSAGSFIAAERFLMQAVPTPDIDHLEM